MDQAIKNKLKPIFQGVGVYIIINRNNGKAYIGSSAKMLSRTTDLLKGQTRGEFRRDVEAFGPDVFSRHCIEEVNNRDDLRKREGYWQERLKPEYNQKIEGKPYPDELRAAISSAKKATGWRPSKEHRARTRAAAIGNKRGLGYKHTDESRKKMSDAKRALR